MKKKLIRIVFVCVLILCMLLAVASCDGKENTEQSESISTSGGESMTEAEKVIFADGEYKCTFIVSGLADTEITKVRNELTKAFKAKTGISPAFRKDDTVALDDSSFEILLGATDRPQSAAPEGTDEDRDVYYSVSFVGNKLVINASDAYRLGLATEYLIDNYLSGEKTDVLTIPADINRSEILKGYTRENWGLPSIPSYPEGSNRLLPNIYNCGTTITDYSAGGRTDESTLLHVIKRSSLEEFSDYMSKLEEFGFKKEYANTIEDNIYAGFYDGSQRVYIAYNGVNSSVRVVLDPVGMSLEEFGYSYTPKAGERSEYYMYGIPMADNNGNGHPNSGMLLVVKCADNSVIIIDGGDGQQQMNDEAVAGLNDFLFDITGTEKGNKVRISAWYMTHYHVDHMIGFYSLLEQYGDNYSLERVIANLPTDDALTWSGIDWSLKYVRQMSTMIKAVYPECKEIKVHTGEKIQIADVTLSVLYTHEDLLNDNCYFNSTDSNDLSTVIRFDNGKMSMLVVGDANARTQGTINNTFTAKTLKSDILQASHHGIYDLEELNKRVAPTVVYLPQASEVARSDEPMWSGAPTTYMKISDKIIALVGEENVYYGGNETVGYAFADGVLTKIYYREGVIGRA